MTTTWILDGIQIDLLQEDEGAFNPVVHAIPTLDAAALEGERTWFDQYGYAQETRSLVLSFHSYLVRVGGKAILIDSCLGNNKSLEFRPTWHRKIDARWLDALSRAGVQAADVDLVINTHLHLDHVGWNTTWNGSEWVPTFPNARYVVAEAEYESALRRTEPSNRHAALHRTSLAESVDPIRSHGLLDLVDADQQIDDRVRLTPTPGHTLGHVGVIVGDHAAVFTGDLLHSPIQAAYPEVHWSGDEDPYLGARTRREFLDRYADTNTLVCTMHFPEPAAGHLRRVGDGYRLTPAASRAGKEPTISRLGQQ
jgi:glyoxylase-like metal-dependent hydrolase (beta-lactamase superfamily II)